MHVRAVQSQCQLLTKCHEGDLLHIDIYDPFLIISYVEYHVVLPMGVGEAHSKRSQAPQPHPQCIALG